ncbi:COP9 signalosome complex subunit 7b [Coemansia spiralis]|uniref:COP9 signalosome complex subunit 7b n=2 Tax=Coemansia TaxID=4863 RepID=A0A9W8KWL0_9FUNG|nr:hypothetical protein BX070DRAFT_254879 [Coemansia spiralis]KAJ1990188.1 COP9 signalosome complex subunit 7b [Coemansia umbellata]KAJ2620714.1 COP9 signalosome complex subunit 7b [Coemansia sp. RSA 1358]KAJ2673977.1 COP9 signalosome complex subunit 7b [Coemansia spiralis]
MDEYLLKLNNVSPVERIPIIQKALEDESIVHYGRLLISPKLEELAQTEEYSSILRQVEIFCYGTLSDYNADAALPQLTPLQTEKLKHLTLISLASNAKVLEYDIAKKELGFDDDQKVEDLVINSTYKKLISARLDQQRRIIEVNYVIGRDVRREDLEDIYNKLEKWAQDCDQVLGDISSEIDVANKTASDKKAQDFEFTKALQTLRTEYTTAASTTAHSASGDNPGTIARNDSQYSSNEYQREEQRTGNAADI